MNSIREKIQEERLLKQAKQAGIVLDTKNYPIAWSKYPLFSVRREIIERGKYLVKRTIYERDPRFYDPIIVDGAVRGCLSHISALLRAEIEEESWNLAPWANAPYWRTLWFTAYEQISDSQRLRGEDRHRADFWISIAIREDSCLILFSEEDSPHSYRKYITEKEALEYIKKYAKDDEVETLVKKLEKIIRRHEHEKEQKQAK